ncbi:hypothetical protein [Chryseobacterium terrae]|uniref:YD repeat-containing protein n=1 Tax=Chryseobacterium terrae TaxID=3163299 RepID=A0ABW8Y3K3_9FLAO
MRRVFLFFLLFNFLTAPAQQKLNWGEILYGNMEGLNKNKIKTLKLKKGNKIIRSVEVISDQEILVKDSLNTQYFGFNQENRLISVKSILDKGIQQFNLNFKDNFINKISKTIDYKSGIVFFDQFSKVSFNDTLYNERETYNFASATKDTLNIFRVRYFFNQQNPNLSYRETYNSGIAWTKKYFNQTEVEKRVFDDHIKIDSLLQKDGKRIQYRFENYPDHQIMRIENDSVLTIQKKLGKKVSEKLEYASLPFSEIFYDENENIKEKIIYKNYQNPFKEWVLWEEIKYDEKGKVLSRKHPNKKQYKLKTGVLVFRKSETIIYSHDYIIKDFPKYHEYYYAQIYSPSILFNLKFSNKFIQNFDTSFFEEGEMIYIYVKFQEDAKIISDYSASKDVKEEGIRTSKSVRRKEWFIKRYFEDLEVEIELITGKKHKIELSQNPELLNFPIHIFIIKE